MRFDDSDRRRLVLASALTIVALPAVWFANREEPSSRPSVAAVGLPAAPAVAASSATRPAVDPMGDVDARYLTDAAPPAARPLLPIAVGASGDRAVATARAIFRRDVDGVSTCRFSGIAAGQVVTVVNLENGRTTECRTQPQPPDAPLGELVMHPTRFAEIADLMDAPVDIELRQ